MTEAQILLLLLQLSRAFAERRQPTDEEMSQLDAAIEATVARINAKADEIEGRDA